MKTKEMIVKTAAVAVLLVIALMSVFVFAKPATDPETYANTIKAIDDKKAAVMTLTATAATASTAIAAIPGDASTPIANQIMEISEYLFLVVCFLVLEKSLLTVLGYLAFKILIPVGCVILAVCLFFRRPAGKTLGLKLIVLGLVLVLIIPFSVRISDMIYEVNSDTVTQLTEEVNGEATEEPTEEEEQSWWEKLQGKVEETVTDTTENAKETLNRFIDAIALFIITYCALPVIVVLAAVWFVKFLFQIPLPAPGPHHRSPLNGKHTEEQEKDTAYV